MAIAALAADDELGRRWRTLVQHRFGGIGALAGHAVGNLLIAGLIDTLGDPVAALDAVAGLLGVRGRVLPMCTEPARHRRRRHRSGRRSGARAPHPGPGGGGVDARPRAAGVARPRPAAGLPRCAGRRPRRRRGRARAGVVVHERAAAPAGPRAARRADRHRGPARSSCSTSRRSRGRRPGSRPSSTSPYSASTPPRCGSTRSWPMSTPCPCPIGCTRAATAILSPGGSVHLAPVAASPIEPSHDPVALAAAIAAVVADVATTPDVAAEGRT